MSNDTYDDGLVHGHGWATEKARPDLGRAPTAATPATPDDEPYDDGLVHGHAWARTEHRQPAGMVLPAE